MPNHIPPPLPSKVVGTAASLWAEASRLSERVSLDTDKFEALFSSARQTKQKPATLLEPKRSLATTAVGGGTPAAEGGELGTSGGTVPNSAAPGGARVAQTNLAPPPEPIRLLDTQRANNVMISLARITKRAGTLDRVADAIKRLDGNVLAEHDIPALLAALPTRDELAKLNSFVDKRGDLFARSGGAGATSSLRRAPRIEQASGVRLRAQVRGACVRAARLARPSPPSRRRGARLAEP
ncbi:hypothetical protein T492DRAFT_29147 [Pavlovales sp. CCMP2436]|nr:hypothetical protein T492DRAFT_29147 [Pavlovales sp. CCMP2436]